MNNTEQLFTVKHATMRQALSRGIRSTINVPSTTKFNTKELGKLLGPFKVTPKASKPNIPLPPPRPKTWDDVLDPKSMEQLTSGPYSLAHRREQLRLDIEKFFKSKSD